MKTIKLHIPQIHCMSCVKLIKMSLDWVDGVEKIDSDLSNKFIFIEYNENLVSKDNIIQSIKKETWYEIIDQSEKELETENWKLKVENWELKTENDFTKSNKNSSKISVLDIQGMHCSSCANIIEKSLKKLSWVESANVNFASEKANIKYDPTKVDIKDLQKAVETAWYKVNLDQNKDESLKRQSEINKWFYKFVWWSILSLPLLALMVYDFISGLPFETKIMPYAAVIGLLLTLPVQFVVWSEFYKGFWSALKMKTFNMYSLIAIGTSVSFVYSLYSLVTYFSQTWTIFGLNWMKVPNIYFEVSALLITFVCLWKYLEARAKWKTSEAINALMWLAPKTAIVKIGHREANEMSRGDLKIASSLHSSQWQFAEIPIERVIVGDIVLVKPWERIPVDWVIIDGNTSIDESMLTWESLPVEKTIWSKVYTWTINKFWSFEFQTTKVWAETSLSQIVRLIEEAQGSKAPIQSIVDKISAVFVPTVIVLAILTFAIWYYFLWASFEFALLSFAGVIVIACPCALWLATPTAIMVGTWIWAKNWILIKWWQPLEVACRITAVVFDKTWTITNWTPKVTDILSLSDMNDLELISIAGSLESKSEHPLAKAITDYSKENKTNNYQIENFEAIPWKGVKWELRIENWELKISGSYYIWTRKLLELNNISIDNLSRIETLENQWKTVMFISTDTKLLWAIAVADTIKDSSVWAIDKLKKLWIQVFMITWDNKRAADFIASQVGIPSQNVLAEVLPQNKAEEVKKLQDKWLIVAMVWDWINDSPALTQSDLWIAMWSGADVAIESGWIIIMKNDLNDVITSLQLSKETVAKIKQNLFFSLFYNVVWIPIAAGFLASLGMVLKPELAWLAMALSSVSVVTNSLLLKWFKPWRINIISKIAPLFMAVLFVFIFWRFVRFADITALNYSSVKVNSWTILTVSDFISTSKSKIAFDAIGLPKLFVFADNLPWELKAIEGKTSLNENEVVIWYLEAQMMRKERLFKNVGDEIEWFFGLPKVKIVWILAPTKTTIDDFHILKSSHFDQFKASEDIVLIKAPDGFLKIFYLYDENNIPQKLKWVLESPTEYSIDNKSYLPLYIGYEEAQMMKKENLFKNEWDKIDGLFWNNVIIKKVLKKDYSNIDMIHYIPKKFKENYLSVK